MEDSENRLVYTVEEVSEILKVSTSTVAKLIKEHKLKASIISGRIYRVLREDLIDFIKQNRV